MQRRHLPAQPHADELCAVPSRKRVRGGREPPYGDGTVELRGERLYGRFHLTVRVPNQYEKRWRHGGLSDGVLRLCYPLDDEPDVE